MPEAQAVREIAAGLWTVEVPLRFLGIEVGRRMSVVRLEGDGLWLHSPAPLTGELRASLEALGEPRYVVAASAVHGHRFMEQYRNRYPDLELFAAPGLDRRRKDLAFDGLLGTAALSYVVPISAVIVGLLVLVALSYRQTIFAYPAGGGSYTVAKDNLGQTPGLVAAAALLTDYILTVAVSISSGVAAIISIPTFRSLEHERVLLCLGLVLVVTLMIIAGATFGLHRLQAGNIAEALLWQVSQAEKEGANGDASGN